ncbi:hypothetical protein F4554_002038 [Actinopolymorpha rutila]|uniref:Uncharacterized protein n=1 Tax=Actinopolymorpha rutila TaxID=446787 RepID=A0A852ZJQ5_9ACTN|nr:hypothetical protein [Actinopolymorpha rutila]
MPDGDHAASGKESRVGDHSRTRRSDRLAVGAEQVDTTVATAPPGIGRIEAMGDLRAR